MTTSTDAIDEDTWDLHADPWEFDVDMDTVWERHVDDAGNEYHQSAIRVSK